MLRLAFVLCLFAAPAYADTAPVPPVHPYFAEVWEIEATLEEGFRRNPQLDRFFECPAAYDLVRGQGAWERDEEAFVSRWRESGRPTAICAA